MWLPWLPYSWVLMAALALAVAVQAAAPGRLPNPSKVEGKALALSRRNVASCFDRDVVIVNGHFRSTHRGDQVKQFYFSCDEGFNLVGKSTVQCWASRGWTSALPTCVKDINYAASRADGKLQPPAMLISAAIGLCQLIHFM